MKLQYLGDAKDSFKWDYIDHLAKELAFPTLAIFPMLTPNDGGGHGGMPPEAFPSGKKMWEFCHELRRTGTIERLRDLPKHTEAAYAVILHKPHVYFKNQNRNVYFTGLATASRLLVFADPDNGFAPEVHVNEKHIRYDEVVNLLEKTSGDSVVTVFQHFRHKGFQVDFDQIKKRLRLDGRPTAAIYATAIYWNGHLMFVTVGKSAEVIDGVATANRRYAEKRYPAVRAIQ
ncbi:MAG: hypothetical protein WCS01_15725 [bacterium]